MTNRNSTSGKSHDEIVTMKNSSAFLLSATLNLSLSFISFLSRYSEMIPLTEVGGVQLVSGDIPATPTTSERCPSGGESGW